MEPKNKNKTPAGRCPWLGPYSPGSAIKEENKELDVHIRLEEKYRERQNMENKKKDEQKLRTKLVFCRTKCQIIQQMSHFPYRRAIVRLVVERGIVRWKTTRNNKENKRNVDNKPGMNIRSSTQQHQTRKNKPIKRKGKVQ